jgi:glycosyltransferase involved in cell wall biosynthesis
VLVCNDFIGERLAGPAIRYWELAHGLARWHEVVLLTAHPPGLESDRVALLSLTKTSWATALEGMDVCITQLVWPGVAAACARFGVRIVLDCYDPMLLEELEAFAGAAPRVRRARLNRTLAKTRMSLMAADAVVCANDRQRDLWLGALMSLGWLTPESYDLDPTLEKLIRLVPFGLPDQAPVRTGPGIRTSLGLSDDDVLLVWGGGVWNWFDPLTLIEALAQLVPEHPSLHLAFLGVKHPNDRVPAGAMAARAEALARRLGLLSTHVHINYGWVPYDERQNHLMDADIGVSTHFDQLETRFAFRTRMLDYLWAGLPIIATEGDSFADLIEEQGAGLTVPAQDIDALVAALRGLLSDRDARERAGRRSREAAASFTWSHVAASLNVTVEAVLTTPHRATSWRATYVRYTVASVREMVVDRRIGELAKRISCRLRTRLRLP